MREGEDSLDRHGGQMASPNTYVRASSEARLSTGPPDMRLGAHAFSSLCNEAGVAWRGGSGGGEGLGWVEEGAERDKLRGRTAARSTPGE